MDRDELLRIIEEARQSDATKLDLSGQDIRELPSEIGQLRQLQVVDCNDNLLTSLPAEIRQVNQLQELNCSRNQLTSLPAEIGQLTQLQML